MGAEIPCVSIIVNGPGKVGKKFMDLLWKKAQEIQEATGFQPRLLAVKSRDSMIYRPQGIFQDDFEEVIRLKTQRAYVDTLEEIVDRGPAILVEATPTNLIDGEPGLSHIRKALERGISVASLAKGPLVLAFKELTDLAAEKGVHLRYSGAVAAALPTLDTAMYAMAGSDIYQMEGVLNGTTNFILNQMSEGKSFDEALKLAQEMGVAERDPSLDVKGLDSAAKLLIIANTVWKSNLTLKDVKVRGIADLSAKEVRESLQEGYAVRLLAKASKQHGDQVELSVSPEKVPLESAFGILDGTKKAFTLRSREMGEVTVMGGASDVLGAAASALKDVFHILQDLGRRQDMSGC